jgi:hypothetical protein
MRDGLKWYDEKADNPPWIKALAEVRHLAPREGWIKARRVMLWGALVGLVQIN